MIVYFTFKCRPLKIAYNDPLDGGGVSYRYVSSVYVLLMCMYVCCWSLSAVYFILSLWRVFSFCFYVNRLQQYLSVSSVAYPRTYSLK